MNNYETVLIVAWQTRNKRHHAKAVVKCKDLGLKPVLKNVFLGKLYEKERRTILTSFKKIFVTKTEKIFSTTVCLSCATNLPDDIKIKVNDLSDLEFIQN